MSAVLKEVVTQVKPVTELFSAADFYTKTPDVVSEIKNRIAIVHSIAFEVTENGKRSLKDYQAGERKIIKATDVVRKEEYARLTGETKKDHDAIFDQLKAWGEAVSVKSNQFEEFEANILKSIRVLLKVEWENIVNQCNTIRPEFLTAHDVEPLVKLTGTLTASGKLTTKANEALRAFILQDLAKQQLHDNRVLTIENRCLRADINPPLGIVHFGEVFWADDVVFEDKVEQLVTAEIARRTEMELRIEAKNKAETQKKIDDALAAQQAEVNRIANEKIKVEEPAKPAQEIRTPELLRARAASIEESAQYADRRADKEAELKGASDLRAEANSLEIAQRIEEANALESTQTEQVKIPGKKTVTITAQFKITVSERISVEAGVIKSAGIM